MECRIAFTPFRFDLQGLEGLGCPAYGGRRIPNVHPIIVGIDVHKYTHQALARLWQSHP
jgi:hypothetical protein